MVIGSRLWNLARLIFRAVSLRRVLSSTLPETNRSPLKICRAPKGNSSSKWLILQGGDASYIGRVWLPVLFNDDIISLNSPVALPVWMALLGLPSLHGLSLRGLQCMVAIRWWHGHTRLNAQKLRKHLKWAKFKTLLMTFHCIGWFIGNPHLGVFESL